MLSPTKKKKKLTHSLFLPFEAVDSFSQITIGPGVIVCLCCAYKYTSFFSERKATSPFCCGDWVAWLLILILLLLLHGELKEFSSFSGINKSASSPP